MAMVNKRTDLFLPVVPGAVLPKQAWQRLLDAVQQHHVRPIMRLELIAAPYFRVRRKDLKNALSREKDGS